MTWTPERHARARDLSNHFPLANPADAIELQEAAQPMLDEIERLQKENADLHERVENLADMLADAVDGTLP